MSSDDSAIFIFIFIFSLFVWLKKTREIINYWDKVRLGEVHNERYHYPPYRQVPSHPGG
jgi:hypothetical protein